MKILVACDKFKGSLTAPEACEAIKTGILEASSNADLQIQLLPVADGGDGIANALTVAQSGEWKTCDVQDALGKSVIAGFGLIEERKTAVIEMATASGLAQLSGRDLDPDKANTFGTGELILAAIAEEVEHVILGIGGSATNDAGTGMASALGWKFLDQDG
ncbi:MAG: glycerate kinase, partial [Verrucomicrobiota bacterium]